MRNLTIAAATVAIAALISAAPVLADHNGGGPIKQNGLCWKASRGSDQMFGHWRTCGEKASLRGGQARGQAQGPAQGQASRQTTTVARAGGENPDGRSQPSKQVARSASKPAKPSAARAGAARPGGFERPEDAEY
jgi:hypothetical protein